jgi:hypothetical protein
MNRRFTRKPYNLNELLETNHTNATRAISIEMVLTLPAADFDAWARNLTTDQDFITAHKGLMHMDEDFTCHCILVKRQGDDYGILVESEGYDYARYAAVWTEQEAAK